MNTNKWLTMLAVMFSFLVGCSTAGTLTRTPEQDRSVFEAINKLGESKHLWITQEFLNCKLKELYLVHEHREKVQEELEEQRRIKDEMREEEKAMKEIEKAKKDKAEGKSASTQAGEFVHDEIEKIKKGEHGVKSAKQAIAIGLSEARRAGVKLPPPKEGMPVFEDLIVKDLCGYRYFQKNSRIVLLYWNFPLY